jgi:ATP-dependent DNA helicase PIF1
MEADNSTVNQLDQGLQTTGPRYFISIQFSTKSEITLEFVEMLNELRFGRLSQESIYKFSKLKRPIEYLDGIQPTKLYVVWCITIFLFSDTIPRFPRTEDVKNSNDIRLQNLASDEYVYMSYDGGTIEDESQRERLLAHFRAPPRLTLKVGAQVMLIRNFDHTLVNGSVGQVIRFSDLNSYISGMDPASHTWNNPLPAHGQLYPVVEFPIGKSGTREVLVQEELWTTELPDGEIQVSRSQVYLFLHCWCCFLLSDYCLQLPLILSWAISIHKSQGQTLDRVKVDLAKVFAHGETASYFNGM